MKTVLPLISAACILGASACAHVQSSEAERATTEQAVAAAETAPPAWDPTKVEGSPTAAAPAPEAPQAAASADAHSQPQMPGDTIPTQAPAPVNTGATATNTGVTGAVPTQAEGPRPASAGQGAPAEGEPLGRFLLTRGVEGREPLEATATFKPGEKVYAFLEVANADGSTHALSLRWVKEDANIGEPVALTIGASPHWRTWSWRRAPDQAGSYRCLVETEDGQQVAEMPFHVENI